MTPKQPRLRDERFLRWLRRRPCDVCGHPAPNDAAHLKAGHVLLGKPWAGTAKPSDMWCSTLCRSCHTFQHAHGDEIGWWQAQGVLNPWALCMRLYAEFQEANPDAPPAKARGPRKVKPRKPREERQKMKGRTEWPRNGNSFSRGRFISNASRSSSKPRARAKRRTGRQPVNTTASTPEEPRRSNGRLIRVPAKRAIEPFPLATWWTI